MHAKWDEMFEEKKEEGIEEVKVKKPRMKATKKKESEERHYKEETCYEEQGERKIQRKKENHKLTFKLPHIFCFMV